MMFTTKTCQICARSGIHHPLSCNLSAVLSLNDDGKQLFCLLNTTCCLSKHFPATFGSFLAESDFACLMTLKTQFFSFHPDTWLEHWIGSVGRDVSVAERERGSKLKQSQTELVTRLSRPDTIKHVSYL